MSPVLQPLVVHLSTVHDRGDVRIFHKQCRTLAAAGYRVTLMVADGRGDEEVEGVHVTDLGRRPTGRLARMTLLPWSALRAVRRLRPALLHFHDPELLPVAGLMARRGLPVVYDAHEDVPQQILAKHWIGPALRPVVSRGFAGLEGFIARRLRAVVVANPPNLARFIAMGCDAICVNNFPLLEEFPAPARPRPCTRTLVYVGGLTRARGLVQLVQALGQMPDVRLLLCGRFADDGCEGACRSLPGWQQVDYRGQVDRRAIQAALAAADIGMVTLLPETNYLVALPVKMFEYMAAELPVVASDIPLWREIIDAHHCGVTVDPADPAAIARAVLGLLADPQCRAMGERGRAAVLAQYHWGVEADKLLALYARACRPVAA
jgi:glycosyltransferase involved in cell wall biosynthesis